MYPKKIPFPSLAHIRKRRKHNNWFLRLFQSSAWHLAWHSFAAFMLGLLLAFIYGMIALYIQKNSMWYCIITTLTMATFTAFGMGLSSRVRTNITLMLPMLCSREGKKFLLFLIFTAVVQGPLNNTLENFDRAAASVMCGAELAINQTQELMQRASTPLLPVLNKVKEVSRNAYSLAGRVRNFINALTDSARHVARSLTNVMHFLANVGDVCNEKMGTPYKKCNAVFDKGRADCMELLSVFSFLCHIVDGFRPLCGLTRVGEFFCVLPSYIASHIKTKLAYPIIAAFDQMKKEFEFNMSASVEFDMTLNSSQSLEAMVQKILEEVSQHHKQFLNFMVIMAYVGLFLLLFMYLQAVLYKRRYLHEDHFDNLYITEQFIEMDRKFSQDGRQAVLPLSDRESRCLRLTAQERRVVVTSLLSLLHHIAMGGVIIALDLMVFWVFDIFHYHSQEEIVARAPVLVDVQVNGSGYASDIFKDILASFDILQKGNITIMSKKCLMYPLEPEYTSYLIIGFLYGLTFFLVIVGGYAKRLQRYVCAQFHPQRERQRILWLRSHILSRRGTLRKALLQAVVSERKEQGEYRVLHTLARHVPGGAKIARFFGLYNKLCLACGKMMKVKDNCDMYICSTLHCTGCFCKQCFGIMGNICAVCMGPLTFQEDSEHELDSSDEEQVNPPEVALTTSSSINQGHAKGRLMRSIKKHQFQDINNSNFGHMV